MGKTVATLVTRTMHEIALDCLQDNPRFDVTYLPDCDRATLLKQISTSEILICGSQTKVDEELIDAAPRLWLVGSGTTGMNHINAPYAHSKGIKVFHCPGRNANAVAEFTLASILALSRQLVPVTNTFKAGIWDRHSFQGRELQHRTLGIWGYGYIGKRVATMAQAFGMQVRVFEQDSKDEHEGISFVTSLSELARQSEFLSLHVPLATNTWGAIDEKILALMPKGSFLINTARGEIVQESALIESLDKGHLAGAAIDTWANEPHPDPAFVRHPKVLATPHLAYNTIEAQLAISQSVIDQVEEYCERREDSRNRRGHPRHPMDPRLASAQLRIQGRSDIAVRINDKSSNGIGVIAPVPLTEGLNVTLDSEGAVPYTVIWCAPVNGHEYLIGLARLSEAEKRGAS